VSRLEVVEVARRLVERTTAEQGLPQSVSDRAALVRIGWIISGNDAVGPSSAEPTDAASA
jgi:hypothetical protein